MNRYTKNVPLDLQHYANCNGEPVGPVQSTDFVSTSKSLARHFSRKVWTIRN